MVGESVEGERDGSELVAFAGFWHGFAVWKLGEAETLSVDGSSHVAVLWR